MLEDGDVIFRPEQQKLGSVIHLQLMGFLPDGYLNPSVGRTPPFVLNHSQDRMHFQTSWKGPCGPVGFGRESFHMRPHGC